MENPENSSKLAEDLSNLLHLTVNEDILLKRMQDYFKPRPASLVETDDEREQLEARLSTLSAKLGGPPDVVVTEDEAVLSGRYDTYGMVAIQEALSMFHRSRRTVCRSHLFFIGSHLVEQHPDWWIPPLKVEEANQTAERLRDCFWDEIEIAYIRIASFWDRVGQLLDFIFFNIRQYERDGFSTVMDRINVNHVRLYPHLRSSPAWEHLRSYQVSETTTGLKWLIRRRNLLIHSLHLRALTQSPDDDPIFIGAYNHIEESVRNKLKPGSTQDELGYVHSHLASAANLFHDVIDFCHLALDTGVVVVLKP